MCKTKPVRQLTSLRINTTMKPYKMIGNLFPKAKDPVPQNQT